MTHRLEINIFVVVQYFVIGSDEVFVLLIFVVAIGLLLFVFTVVIFLALFFLFVVFVLLSFSLATFAGIILCPICNIRSNENMNMC